MAKFEITSTDGKARVGKLITPRGEVETPVYLPVGTQATVKALDSRDLLELNCDMILANTYHLYLRPGADNMEKMGGLHKFMNWNKPILTDSGGFQVFSLGFGVEHEVGKMVPLYGGADMVSGHVSDLGNLSDLSIRTKLCKIEEEGPTFQSHIDGSIHFFPPEKSIEVQIKLGADFVVALDECTSPLHDYDYTKTSMGRSHRWEDRSLKYLKSLKELNNLPAMFGVVQGGPFEDLRIESTKFVSENDFFGVGIGGALVSKQKMAQILDWMYPHLHPEKPRHLLGIGTIDDIFTGVSKGMDIFDCVYPTRIARAGLILHKRLGVGSWGLGVDANVEKVYNQAHYYYDVTKSLFVTDTRPLEVGCTCYSCQNYTRAYIHQLFRTHELLSYKLATIHNVHFMLRLMKNIRQAIREMRFDKLKAEWV